MRFLHNLLKDWRLVTPRRKGTRIYYSLTQQHLVALYREAEFSADHLINRIHFIHPQSKDYRFKRV